MKSKLLILSLSIFVISLSCIDKKEQDVAVEEITNVSSKKIQLFYRKISVDSIEIRVEYVSALDTINASEQNERFLFLYWTKENISTKEIEEIIENDDKDRMKEENLIGYNLGDKRSMVFNYKLIPEEENHLTVLVEDLAFITDFAKDSTRIIQNISTVQERVMANGSH